MTRLHWMRRALLFGFLCIVVLGLLSVITRPPASAPKPDYSARIAALEARYSQALDPLRISLSASPALISTRALSRAALFELAVDHDADQAEAFLSLGYSYEDLDASSADYGRLSHQKAPDPDAEDNDTDEFEYSALGPILLGYRDQLSPAFLTSFLPHAQAALSLIRRHQPSIEWTNMYLINTVNRLLLGKALDNADAVAEGTKQLDDWIAYTQTNGIHEFDSPTYYAVDLDALYLGYQFAPDLRDQFKTILDYFWRDIAANYFDASLSGAHSRDNDYLYGEGDVNVYAYYEGLTPTLEGDLSSFARIPLVLGNPYHPDASILALAQLPERQVVQRWGSAPGQDRTNYVTPDFAVSSVSAGYGPQDKVVSVQLPGDVPNITVVPDTYDAPWGFITAPSPSGAGRSKPAHPLLRPVAVQYQGTILALFSIDRESAPQTGELGTNVILPADVDQILADGSAVTPGDSLDKILSPTSVVAVLKGQSGVAVRLFGIEDCTQRGQTVLQSDSVGISHDAIRLTHYHGCPDHISDKTRYITVGVLIAAQHTPTSEDLMQLSNSIQSLDIQTTQTRTTITASTTLDGVTLSITQDTSTGGLINRTINGQQPIFPTFAVNGVESMLP